MAIKPTITKGIGALDPEAWRQIVEAVTFIREKRQGLERLLRDTGGAGNAGPLLLVARITSSEAMENGKSSATNIWRWKYAWERVRIEQIEEAATPTKTVVKTSTITPGNPDEVIGTVADATWGTTPPVPATWALNALEIGNTAQQRSGYQTDAATGQVKDGGGSVMTGWTVQPIPTGTMVLMSSMRMMNGRIQHYFTQQNPVNGECPSAFYMAEGGPIEEGELPL